MVYSNIKIVSVFPYATHTFTPAFWYVCAHLPQKFIAKHRKSTLWFVTKVHGEMPQNTFFRHLKASIFAKICTYYKLISERISVGFLVIFLFGFLHIVMTQNKPTCAYIFLMRRFWKCQSKLSVAYSMKIMSKDKHNFTTIIAYFKKNL